MKKLIYQIKNTSYLEVYLISGNKIIDVVTAEDNGQIWLISKKLQKAFIIPDRSEGLTVGSRTIFFYSADNALPLSIEDKEEIEQQDKSYVYGIDSENKVIRFSNRILKNPDELILRNNPYLMKIKAAEIRPTTISTEALKALIETKVLTDLLKSPENIFEQLKTPIIIGIIAITIMVFMFSI